MSNIKNFSKALAFITLNELETVGFKVTAEWDSEVVLRIYDPSKLTPEEYRQIKRVFGPLKASGGPSWRGLKGQVDLDDTFSVKLEIDKAFVCEKVEPKDLTMEKWEDIRRKVMAGDVEVHDCNPIEAKKAEPESEVKDIDF